VKGQFRFSKKERIDHSQDFKRVMRSGKRVQSKSIILFTHNNRLGFHRLGMVVKKEVGPATCRNRIKRYFREFFRLNKHRIGGSLDIVILAKKGNALRRFKEAEAELKGLFVK
jgi:ribonuclease P protein component